MLEKLVAEDYKLLMRELDESLRAKLLNFIEQIPDSTMRSRHIRPVMDEITYDLFGCPYDDVPAEMIYQLQTHIRNTNLVERYPLNSDTIRLVPTYVDLITKTESGSANPIFEKIADLIYSTLECNKGQEAHNMIRKPDDLFKYTLATAFAVHGLTKRKNRQLYIEHIFGALEKGIDVHASDDSLSIINIHDVGEEITSRKCRLRNELTYLTLPMEIPDIISDSTLEGDVETMLLDVNIDKINDQFSRISDRNQFTGVDGKRISMLKQRLRQLSKTDPQHYAHYSSQITDLGASLAKLADNLDNTASIGTFDHQKQFRLAFKTMLLFETRKGMLQIEDEVNPATNGYINSNDDIVLITQNRRLWGSLYGHNEDAEIRGHIMTREDFKRPVNGHGLVYEIYSQLQRIFDELYDPAEPQMDKVMMAAEIYQTTLNFRFVHYRGDIDKGLRKYVDREFSDLADEIMKFDETILKYYFATEANVYRQKGELGFIENDDKIGLFRDTVMLMAIIQRYYSHPDVEERLDGFTVRNLQTIRNQYMGKR